MAAFRTLALCALLLVVCATALPQPAAKKADAAALQLPPVTVRAKAGQCWAQCSSNADCASGCVCQYGRGSGWMCAPGGGTCGNQCASNDDCAAECSCQYGRGDGWICQPSNGRK